MKEDYLKDTIKEQFKEVGAMMYKTNAEVITDGLNGSSPDIVPINMSSLEKGKFYFMFYDLAGKSSRMEKFNPLFVIDWIDMDSTRYVYAVSINFIPISIRTVFFNKLCNYNISRINKNVDLDTEGQYSFENIDFTNIYKLLYTIGFEWSIRKFDCKLINKIYAISTNILPTFLTMSTAGLTGVDDSKLIEIWNKKIQEQELRHKKLIKEILGDYKNMEQELTKAYSTLDSKNSNLEKSLQLIKNIL
jgi:flagellar capping protein FliD